MMTPAPPVATVLLPVHNGADYIESAVRSMMAQTLRDIEILVVDDGSTDATPEILARLAAEDDRIRVVRPEANLRLPRALNFGLDRARGRYVARMDADDLSEPTRLEVQVRFLEAHPDIDLVGCSALHIDAEGRATKASIRAQTPYCTRWMVRFVMPFRHPTFLFRREAVPLRYDPDRTVSEDYDFLARLTGTRKAACLPDVLLRYREHGGSLTESKWSLMLTEAKQIALGVQRADLTPAIFEGLAPFRAGYFDQSPLSPGDRDAMFAGLSRMAAADAAAAPEHRAWIARQTAQLAAHALMRSGLGGRGIAAAFLRHGGRLRLPFAMRFAETRRLLPRLASSEPVVR